MDIDLTGDPLRNAEDQPTTESQFFKAESCLCSVFAPQNQIPWFLEWRRA